MEGALLGGWEEGLVGGMERGMRKGGDCVLVLGEARVAEDRGVWSGWGRGAGGGGEGRGGSAVWHTR